MKETKSTKDTLVTPNEKHKSSVFCMLFNEPDALRELYSAIEGVDLPPDIPIDINTMSNALVMGKLNDISFAVDNRLVVLIEHQSSINKNMPFRLLDYIVLVYKGIIDYQKMYKRTLVGIPRPEFIVLYNGTDKYDDYTELKLSDAFMDIQGLKAEGNQDIALELIVKVYNINFGHNPKMLEKSAVLNNYSLFIDKIREYQNTGLELAESVKCAIKYCIENNILKDFLKIHGGEVTKMFLEEYTVENAILAEREEAWEQGREEGREQGRTERDKYFLDLINQGLSLEEIKQQVINCNK